MKNRVDIAVGTGFLVGRDGFAMTARHVTRGAQEMIAARGGNASLLAGLALPNLSSPMVMRGNFELIDCHIVEEDPRHDLSLLRLRSNPFASGRASGISRTDEGLAVNAMYAESELSLRVPRDGERIGVSGYPMNEPVLITTSGKIASAWASEVSARIDPSHPEFEIPDIPDAYVADVAANPGNSGGPVYFADWGDVIGVCVSFRVATGTPENADPFFYNSGLAVVVPVRYVRDLLARHEESSA